MFLAAFKWPHHSCFEQPLEQGLQIQGKKGLGENSQDEVNGLIDPANSLNVVLGLRATLRPKEFSGLKLLILFKQLILESNRILVH